MAVILFLRMLSFYHPGTGVQPAAQLWELLPIAFLFALLSFSTLPKEVIVVQCCIKSLKIQADQDTNNNNNIDIWCCLVIVTTIISVGGLVVI